MEQSKGYNCQFKEISNIKDQFCEVIRESQGISDPKVDALFDKWLEAKKYFIDAWHGNFIVEYPEKVSFELDENEKQNQIDGFLERIEGYWGRRDVAEFLDHCRSGFFSNTVPSDYTTDDDVLIPSGMRILKALKFFNLTSIQLDGIQTEASMIIQKDKVEGTLCLSVHPLDYLSSSENTHNWRSCHALDGEYRSGNLSYMVDSCTILVYLKSEQPAVLPNFPQTVPWNNKKWRMLLHFSENRTMLFAGRQYPFSSMAGLEFVRQSLLPKFELGVWSDWNRTKVSYVQDVDHSSRREELFDSYVPIYGRLRPMRNVVKDGANALNFNDILRSSCYDPYYCFSREHCYWGPDSPKEKFIIGGEVPCLQCGQNHLECTNLMQCVSCEEKYGTLENDDFGYCACCGRHIFLPNAYWVDNDPVCSICKDNGEIVICGDCGRWVFKEQVTFDAELNKPTCGWCKIKPRSRSGFPEIPGIGILF